MPQPTPSARRISSLVIRVAIAQAVAMADGETPGEPLQAQALAALERRISELVQPEELLALATQIDQLGMQLAYEIRRYGARSELAAPLKPVLMRVPIVHARALLRTAERFDDVGSPRRAAFVLIEALRKSFAADALAAAAEALSFILEAHGQTAASIQLRDLMTSRGSPQAGSDRREVRAQFEVGLDRLRDHAIDWLALDDEPQVD